MASDLGLHCVPMSILWDAKDGLMKYEQFIKLSPNHSVSDLEYKV